MTEEKKIPENELSDEKLDKIAGGAGKRAGTFICASCFKEKALTQQSPDP